MTTRTTTRALLQERRILQRERFPAAKPKMKCPGRTLLESDDEFVANDYESEGSGDEYEVGK